MSNPDELDDGLLYEYESDTPAADNLDADENEVQETETETDNNKRVLEEEDSKTENLSKRQKKLKNSKLHERRKEQAQYQEEHKKKIPKSSADQIADYFTTLIREKNPDLSALELEELYLKKSDFISTEKFDEAKERNLINFQEFMTQFSRSPKAIVFSMSNIRVADLSRSLGGNKTAVKLFAKNKLQEDLDTIREVLGGQNKRLKGIKYFIATPTRMEKLLEVTDLFFEGKDKLDIILDASYFDPKKNSLIASENTVLLCKVLKIILKKKSSVKVLLY